MEQFKIRMDRDYLIEKILETVKEAEENKYSKHILDNDLNQLFDEYEDQLWDSWGADSVENLQDQIDDLEGELEETQDELEETKDDLYEAQKRIEELTEKIEELGGEA